ncbi:MAG: hypothetical protein KDE27_30410 [Planctomycetes bacterium]|nr:hypothetical protein [Planctomycetota bacterium]
MSIPRLLPLLYALAGPLLAQQPPEATAPTTPAAPANPFVADEEIQRLLGGTKPDPLAFQPLAERPALPDMRLRGIVRLKRKAQPAALVELTGYGSYTVRQGESISFTLPGRALAAPRVDPTGRTGQQGPTAPSTTPKPELWATSSQRERLKELGAGPTAATTAGTPATTGAGRGVTISEPIPIVLRVERIEKDGVVVEIGTMGQYLVIR